MKIVKVIFHNCCIPLDFTLKLLMWQMKMRFKNHLQIFPNPRILPRPSMLEFFTPSIPLCLKSRQQLQGQHDFQLWSIQKHIYIWWFEMGQGEGCIKELLAFNLLVLFPPNGCKNNFLLMTWWQSQTKNSRYQHRLILGVFK